MLWQGCTPAGHSGGVTSVTFSPDGKCIVSGSKDNLVKVWDSATGAEVSLFSGSGRKVEKPQGVVGGFD